MSSKRKRNILLFIFFVILAVLGTLFYFKEDAHAITEKKLKDSEDSIRIQKEIISQLKESQAADSITIQILRTDSIAMAGAKDSIENLNSKITELTENENKNKNLIKELQINNKKLDDFYSRFGIPKVIPIGGGSGVRNALMVDTARFDFKLDRLQKNTDEFAAKLYHRSYPDNKRGKGFGAYLYNVTSSGSTLTITFYNLEGKLSAGKYFAYLYFSNNKIPASFEISRAYLGYELR